MRNQRFLAPLISIGIGVTLLLVAILNLNQPTSSMFDTDSASYFIKPVEINHLYVVEPNMEGYMNENIDPPNLEEVVYSSLDELDQRYEIDRTEIVNIERKGVTIPNLYVYVHPSNSPADVSTIPKGGV
ncbi:hypothetical protein [Leptolyngbya ohadii]|uniref:hypothetical protein n=1 Tax=Leptolyngbya ohadii TaxID=1962290 RepID=UPI000B59CA28|nr:hypothetical protein [Leptolyngbya ohadii]